MLQLTQPAAARGREESREQRSPCSLLVLGKTAVASFQMCALAFSSGASERCGDGKLYTCQTCQKRFSGASALAAHPMWSHAVPDTTANSSAAPQGSRGQERHLEATCPGLGPSSAREPLQKLELVTGLCRDGAGGAGRSAPHLLPPRWGIGGGGPGSPLRRIPWFARPERGLEHAAGHWGCAEIWVWVQMGTGPNWEPALVGWAYGFSRHRPGSYVWISLRTCH